MNELQQKEIDAREAAKSFAMTKGAMQVDWKRYESARTHVSFEEGVAFGTGFESGFDAGIIAGQPKWVRIDGPEDLPTRHGMYLVTHKIIKNDPMQEPHVTQFGFNDIYRERFWLGSFSAWMEVPLLPEPYQPQGEQKQK